VAELAQRRQLAAGRRQQLARLAAEVGVERRPGRVAALATMSRSRSWKR